MKCWPSLFLLCLIACACNRTPTSPLVPNGAESASVERRSAQQTTTKSKDASTSAAHADASGANTSNIGETDIEPRPPAVVASKSTKKPLSGLPRLANGLSIPPPMLSLQARPTQQTCLPIGSARDNAPASDASASTDASTPSEVSLPSTQSTRGNNDAGTVVSLAGLPQLLSKTGCFTSLEPYVPGPDLMRYEVASELWGDGAYKERYLVLPPGTEISSTGNDWRFPTGAVLIKTFGIEFVAGDSTSRRPVETRFLRLLPDDAWQTFTYQWNDSATEATLLKQALSVDFTLTEEGQQTSLNYRYPGPAECGYCHGFSIDVPIGPSSEQFALVVNNGETLLTELELFKQAGLIAASVPEAKTPVINPSDTTFSAESRARSYLHANCAHCHRPQGKVPPALNMNLLIDTPVAELGLCNVPVDSPWGGSVRLAPGDLEDSHLLYRMTRTAKVARATYLKTRMPPVGTVRVDPVGVDALSRWIEELSTCPE